MTCRLPAIKHPLPISSQAEPAEDHHRVQGSTETQPKQTLSAGSANSGSFLTIYVQGEPKKSARECGGLTVTSAGQHRAPSKQPMEAAKAAHVVYPTEKSLPRSRREVLSWPFCCDQPAAAAVVRHLEFHWVWMRASEGECERARLSLFFQNKIESTTTVGFKVCLQCSVV